MIMGNKVIKIKELTMPKKNKGKKRMIPIEKTATICWGKSQGEYLRVSREAKGLSMEKLSEKLKEYGVNCVPSNLVKLEKGTAQTIKTETLLILISILDIDLKYFLN